MPKSNRDPDRSTTTARVANGDSGPSFTKEPRYTFAYSPDGKHVRITESGGQKHVYPMIPKPENPGKCVLEEKMHMPKDDPRHEMYLNIFDSMRSNSRQMLGKDGLDVLWNEIPIEVRADILNMTAEEHPILKRFVGGWAGNEILIRILRNARDQAKRNKKDKKKRKSKPNAKVTKQVVTAGETSNSAGNGDELSESAAPNESGSSKSNSNAADEDHSTAEHATPLKGVKKTTGKESAPTQPVDKSDDEENWLAEPIAPVATKKPTKAGHKGAPTRPTVAQNGEDEGGDEDETQQTAPAKFNRPEPAPKPAPKGQQKAARLVIESDDEDNEDDEDDEDEDRGSNQGKDEQIPLTLKATKPKQSATSTKSRVIDSDDEGEYIGSNKGGDEQPVSEPPPKPAREKQKANPAKPPTVESDNESEGAPKPAKPVSESTSQVKSKRTISPAVLPDNESTDKANPRAEPARPKKKNKSTAAKDLIITMEDAQDESPAVPSGQGSKRKRTEPDEDGSERAPSKPRATLPTARPVRNISPELPSTPRDTSPAPTEIFSSPIPVQQTGNKKRKAEELAREESESWETNVEVEIAKLEAISRDAKKGKPSDEPPPAKDKAPLKTPRGKKAAQCEDSVEDVQEEEVLPRKRPTPRKARKPGEADSEDLFVVTRQAKEELVESIDVGGSKRKTRNQTKKKK